MSPGKNIVLSLPMTLFFFVVGFFSQPKFTIHSLRFNSFAMKLYWEFRFSIWIMYVIIILFRICIACLWVSSKFIRNVIHFVQQFQQLSIDITIGITEFLLGMTNLLIYCYLGKLANASYAKMPNRIFYMKWFELPNKLQRYYILMIKNMQIPLYYRGFGVIHLDLETFTKVSVNPFQWFSFEIIWYAKKKHEFLFCSYSGRQFPFTCQLKQWHPNN